MKSLSVIISILAIVAMLGIIAIAYMTCSGTPLIQRIDQVEPTEMQAPFKVWTVTRTYLAKQATLNDDGTVTMRGFYEKDGSDWKLRDREYTIPKLFKPQVSQR